MNNDSKKSEEKEMQLPVRARGTSPANIKGTAPSVDRLSDLVCRELIKKAMEMLKYSYSPYSNFRVGAALMTKKQTVYTGCNIENVAFGPSNCAERTAFFKAVSEGERDFEAIAIVGGKEGMITDYCPPCGVCRQVMAEFCDPDAFFVILAKSEDDYWIYSLRELFPMGFTPEKL